MSDINKPVYYYRGQDVDTMTRQQLIDALKDLGTLYQRELGSQIELAQRRAQEFREIAQSKVERVKPKFTLHDRGSGNYELLGYGHCGNGATALYKKGTRTQCIADAKLRNKMYGTDWEIAED